MQNAYTVLITGANRGLGLEFSAQYAADGWQVLACCRDPSRAPALNALAKSNPNVQIHRLDVADFPQVEALATTLKNTAIDLLINNAGIYPESVAGNINPAATLDTEAWLTGFKVNSIAPLKVAHAFTPHIMQGQLKKIATLSSKMGSLDDNSSGGSYMYRSTKTAVNMVMKSLSIDLQPLGIAVVTLHPGWVQTDMGGSNALIDTQTSINGLRKVIEHLNLDNSGRFIAYDGKEINW